MSIAHRTERWRVFGYSAGGGDGWIEPSYAYLAEWWARGSSMATGEQSPAGHEQHGAQVLVTFAAEATIPANGLLKAVTGRFAGRKVRVTGVEPVRDVASLDELQVTGVIVDDADAAYTTTGEPEES